MPNALIIKARTTIDEMKRNIRIKTAQRGKLPSTHASQEHLVEITIPLIDHHDTATLAEDIREGDIPKSETPVSTPSLLLDESTSHATIACHSSPAIAPGETTNPMPAPRVLATDAAEEEAKRAKKEKRKKMAIKAGEMIISILSATLARLPH